jgi:hypothetical protein
MKRFIRFFKSAFMIALTMILAFACRKADPFFDSFPKKFVFGSIENLSPPRVFTNGKEIKDYNVIDHFAGRYSFFLSDTTLITAYKNEVYTFLSNSVIGYSGRNDFGDSLFYSKNGDNLFIKTGNISVMGRASYLCTSNLCQTFSWEVDSIDYIPFVNISVFVKHLRYIIIGNEMHIPVLGLYYKDHGFSIAYFIENEFNEDVIQNMKTDTLAIIEYNLKLKEISR